MNKKKTMYEESLEFFIRNNVLLNGSQLKFLREAVSLSSDDLKAITDNYNNSPYYSYMIRSKINNSLNKYKLCKKYIKAFNGNFEQNGLGVCTVILKFSKHVTNKDELDEFCSEYKNFISDLMDSVKEYGSINAPAYYEIRMGDYGDDNIYLVLNSKQKNLLLGSPNASSNPTDIKLLSNGITLKYTKDKYSSYYTVSGSNILGAKIVAAEDEDDCKSLYSNKSKQEEIAKYLSSDIKKFNSFISANKTKILDDIGKEFEYYTKQYKDDVYGNDSKGDYINKFDKEYAKKHINIPYFVYSISDNQRKLDTTFMIGAGSGDFGVEIHLVIYIKGDKVGYRIDSESDGSM